MVVWPRVRLEHGLLVTGIVALLMSADGQVAHLAGELPHGVVAVARTITDLGTSLYMFVLSALVAVCALLMRGRAGRGQTQRRVDAGLAVIAERAAFVFAAVAAAGIAAQIVKHFVGRARPRFLDTLGPYHFEFLSLQAKHNSFPSGHTANAVAAALALGIVWPRARWWLLGAAAIVALSRIAVHAHYPGDTAAGALLGYGCALGVGLLFARKGIAVRQVDGRLVGRGQRAVAAALTGIRGRSHRSGALR